jgi:MFS family permease
MGCGAACVAQGVASDSYAALIACRIVFGLGFAFIWTSGIAWLTDSAGLEHRARRLSITIALAGISSFVGPGFAGLLAERTGPGLPFTLTGVALLVLALGLVGPARSGVCRDVESEPLRDWIGRTLGSGAPAVLEGVRPRLRLWQSSSSSPSLTSSASMKPIITPAEIPVTNPTGVH